MGILTSPIFGVRDAGVMQYPDISELLIVSAFGSVFLNIRAYSKDSQAEFKNFTMLPPKTFVPL